MKNRFHNTRLFLESFEKNNQGKFILDAGAGERPYEVIFKNNFYSSQDFGKYEKGGNTLEYDKVESIWDSKSCQIICDIYDIPKQDATYDLVLCTEVLEHLQYPDKCITELIRVLKIGGQLLITMPYGCHYHQEPYFFNSGLSHHWFKKVADDNSCEIGEMLLEGDYLTFLFNENKSLYRLQKNTFKRFVLFIWNIFSFLIENIFRALKINFPKYHSGIFCIFIKTQK